MTGTGPVEPVNSSETGESHDVIGVDSPRPTDRLRERWSALPPRTRTAALLALLTAAVATGVLLAPHHHRTERPEPAPWPANVTAWHYLGPVSPPNSPAFAGRFRFAVTVGKGPPVTLEVTGASSPGLRARALPEPDFTVRPGTPRRITVQISVSHCSGLPLNADLPFLDVTLRNTRAIQRHSFIFGGAFSRDLSELLHAACAPTSS
ncbi:hypothetical protein [Streptomyces resistomycificus]|uniref:Tat pathway signal sequence domain protein n=1 Tax=Streptomyces resistomycificus TaxID=67356 RepID=A0A0L8L1V3_9ACTN|nr:hypothetical protein [Streptomyces resistomycificus]KOG32064.1 hypothetical protein ADK37_28555 [Streptomyces resistomycificus]KUN93856.1 hypothetical protein AQJ84_28425 [Streptomyces resistomycificus]